MTNSCSPILKLPAILPVPAVPIEFLLIVKVVAVTVPFAVILPFEYILLLAFTTLAFTISILALEVTNKLPIVVVLSIRTESPVTVTIFALPAAEIVTFALGATCTLLVPLTIADPAAIVKLVNKKPSP